MAMTPTTERHAALALAEGALWLTLVGGILSVVAAAREAAWILLGWDWLGRGTKVASLPATLNAAGLEQTDLPHLEWTDSNGTVDAATGRPPVEIGGPVEVDVTLWGLTAGEDLARLAPSMMLAVGVVAASWLLLRIVRSARAGEVFTMANAYRLRWLACVTGIGGLAHNAIAAFGPNWILSRSAVAEYVDTSTYTMSFAPVIVFLVLAALAVIWEHGVRLARDADGLV